MAPVNLTDPTAEGPTTASTNGAALTDPDVGSTSLGDGAPAVTSGLATRYWDQLISYPASSTNRLWLFVDNGWRGLANPAPSVRDVVQRAFLGSGQTVRVWYEGSVVHGLVVNN